MDANVRETFKFHPRKDKIIPALKNNQLSIAEIDQVFNEAEYYTMRAWFRAINLAPSSNNNDYVTFKIRSSD
mgnify:CR=1 FL=1